MNTDVKDRAPRNRTLTLDADERERLSKKLLRPPLQVNMSLLTDQIICGNSINLMSELPARLVDLLILDCPYNLTKTFGFENFREKSSQEYERWFESWFVKVLPALKTTSSLYVCGDWKCSAAIYNVLDRHVIIRNRITWEREKGRGANANWKNASEDVWFATFSDEYYFNVEAVKLKRRVLAPYRENGKPKDWDASVDGSFRLTHPSNLWTDLTVPFWSMPENTDHPTQKPEKLFAKMILASSREDDLVFDPFLGSGTSAAVARKLKRRFLAVEQDETYACLAVKRVELAERDPAIQGYSEGVFWERNTLSLQMRQSRSPSVCQSDFFESSVSSATKIGS
ncbi:MAG: site-specific DNA-methyltransferase [Verrucomicrobiota bacterium]|jgi:site-specific DNA-methyltransferase (adenine-specific)